MIKIFFAGDFFPNSRVKKLVEKRKFGEIFGDFTTIIPTADYSLVNLECPVVIGERIAAKKYGPNLYCTPKAIEALKYAGFSMVTLANNHFYDYGEAGVNDTLSICKDNEIDTIGGGRNLLESQRIKYQLIGDKYFAFLNFCEHEFSIATTTSGGSNPLNPVLNYYQIQEAKKNSDYVIVLVHGGHEHYQLPSPRMVETYRFFIDSGADIVINNHQHCFSGYESYNGKLIFYGLGNFSFDWNSKRNSLWNYGYAIILFFSKSKIDFKLYPYIQGDENPGIKLIKDTIEFNKTINRLNSIITDHDKLINSFDELVSSLQKDLVIIFEPYLNKYLKALRKRNLIPSLLSQKKILMFRNLIECEARRDLIIASFKKI